MTVLLPLFPLPLVLFPGQVQILRIFEPRYRAMLRDCLESERVFGIVLANPPQSDGGESLPSGVGTLAHIAQVEPQADGTTGIRIFGGERFRILSFHHDKSYLQAAVATLPMLQTETDLAYELHKRLYERLPVYLEALVAAYGLRLNVHTLPPEPEQLAYLTAIVLQVDNQEKQALLAIQRLPQLIVRELQILSQEVDLCQWMSMTLESAQARGFGADGWLSPN